MQTSLDTRRWIGMLLEGRGCGQLTLAHSRGGKGRARVKFTSLVGGSRGSLGLRPYACAHAQGCPTRAIVDDGIRLKLEAQESRSLTLSDMGNITLQTSQVNDIVHMHFSVH